MVSLGPTIRQERTCGECGAAYIPRRHDQAFCSPACRFEDHNRAMRRGREAYRALYHWRLGHGKGQRGSLLSVASALAKDWVQEDKAAGRNPPPFPEELQTRKVQARYGYVRERGKGYVHSPDKAEAVLEELS